MNKPEDPTEIEHAEILAQMMSQLSRWVRPGERLRDSIAAFLWYPREPDAGWLILTSERLLFVGERPETAQATFRSYPFDQITSIKMSRFRRLAKIEVSTDQKIGTFRAWKDLAAPFISQIVNTSAR